MSLESPWMWNCPGTRSPGFQSCPDDFSEMIYCGALFCPGRPRFVLLWLYHSSAAAINPPCLLLLIQRHIVPSALHRELGDEMAERLSIAAERETKRERQGEGSHEWVCWVHSLTWMVGSLERKEQGLRGRGEQVMWVGFVHLLGAWASWKETFPVHFILALCLSCLVRHWNLLLVSPANEAALIFQFWLDSLTLVGHLGSVWTKRCQTGIKWQKRRMSRQPRKLNLESVVWLVTQIWFLSLRPLGNFVIFSYILNREYPPFTPPLCPMHHSLLIVQRDCPEVPKCPVTCWVLK